jgi:hypothetical protein
MRYLISRWNQDNTRTPCGSIPYSVDQAVPSPLGAAGKASIVVGMETRSGVQGDEVLSLSLCILLTINNIALHVIILRSFTVR